MNRCGHGRGGVSIWCLLVFLSLESVSIAISFVNGHRNNGQGEGVEVSFSARNLPSTDLFNGPPDAYINVYQAADSLAPYWPVGPGRTVHVLDNRDPDWPEVFTLNYTVNGDGGGGDAGAGQMLKVDMYDADWWPDSDDYMGFVEIPIEELVKAFQFSGVVQRNVTGSPGGGGGDGQGGQLLIKLSSS